MNTIKIFSIALLTSTTLGFAQDVEVAKKMIDAEKYEKAKSTLKSILQAKPSNGKAAFLLGNIYLKQSSEDSAKLYFDKGMIASEGAKFNSIGLGHLDLNNGNSSAAKSKFDAVMSSVKKKDFEELVYIAQAYINADKPDYKTAITLLEKAKLANPNAAEVFMTLGDAHYGNKDQNAAYSAYSNAYRLDPSMIRAKMQLGVLLKGAKAYTEAVKAYEEVIKIDANYGPVYRELAETYYYWANNQPKTYNDNIAKALSNYEKYMSLTDYSLSSRMRHADFLILAKDYKALEVEANEMKKLDKVNPRILRYLGYSSYENGNADSAISSLTEFINKGSNKIIGGDYYYLGLAQIKKSANVDAKTVDATLMDSGIQNLKKGVEMSPSLANALNEVGKDYFAKKLYTVSQSIFDTAIMNKDSKNFLEDNIYFGLSVITNNRGKDAKTIDVVSLEKANLSMDNVITSSPNYQEAYLYKARINNTLDKDDVMATNYQKYVELVEAKGAEEVNKNKAKMTESYNNMAAFYANTDKVKAKELLNKTIALDPNNTYAVEALKTLK
jgi:lipopolysaccharide biosynthesis regulator YciM